MHQQVKRTDAHCSDSCRLPLFKADLLRPKFTLMLHLPNMPSQLHSGKAMLSPHFIGRIYVSFDAATGSMLLAVLLQHIWYLQLVNCLCPMTSCGTAQGDFAGIRAQIAL